MQNCKGGGRGKVNSKFREGKWEGKVGGVAKTEREGGRIREIISKRKEREVYRGSRETIWRNKEPAKRERKEGNKGKEREKEG